MIMVKNMELRDPDGAIAYGLSEADFEQLLDKEQLIIIKRLGE